MQLYIATDESKRTAHLVHVICVKRIVCFNAAYVNLECYSSNSLAIFVCDSGESFGTIIVLQNVTCEI